MNERILEEKKADGIKYHDMNIAVKFNKLDIYEQT